MKHRQQPEETTLANCFLRWFQ